MVETDPIHLSRRLGRAEEARFTWELGLKSSPVLDDVPLGVYREVLGQEQFALVQELPEDDPLRQPLSRWLFRLIERRVDHQGLVLAAQRRYVEKHRIDAPGGGKLSLAELMFRMLSEAPRREQWWAAFSQSAATASETCHLLRLRRVELAQRLGLTSPDSMELPGDDLQNRAEQWLELTRPLAEEHTIRSWADWLAVGLDDANAATWPARLDERALAAWFRSTRLLDDLQLRTEPLPPCLAPSSFLRGLQIMGHGFQRAAASKTQPFVVVADPQNLAAHATGALFALLPANREFCVRELDVSRDAVGQHRRVLARVVLCESRLRAIRVLLRASSLDSATALHEQSQSLMADWLGCESPPDAVGVAVQFREDDVQRFAACFLAAARQEQLQLDHDEDWYRNPRAADQLRSEAQLPPATTLDSKQLERAQSVLLGWLTDALQG